MTLNFLRKLINHYCPGCFSERNAVGRCKISENAWCNVACCSVRPCRHKKNTTQLSCEIYISFASPFNTGMFNIYFLWESFKCFSVSSHFRITSNVLHKISDKTSVVYDVLPANAQRLQFIQKQPRISTKYDEFFKIK